MQETRGASLSTTTRRCIWLFAVIGGVVWGLDQLTKTWAVAALSSGRVVEIVPGVFDLVLTRNPGAAFSLGTGLTAALSVLAIVVVVVVIRAASRLRDTGWAIGQIGRASCRERVEMGAVAGSGRTKMRGDDECES